jgi:hypothetical protein
MRSLKIYINDYSTEVGGTYQHTWLECSCLSLLCPRWWFHEWYCIGRKSTILTVHFKRRLTYSPHWSWHFHRRPSRMSGCLEYLLYNWLFLTASEHPSLIAMSDYCYGNLSRVFCLHRGNRRAFVINRQSKLLVIWEEPWDRLVPYMPNPKASRPGFFCNLFH